MKKKIFGGIAIVAIALAVAFNVSLSNQKQDKASMLALANVEVLAEAESDCFLKVNCKIIEEYEDITYYHWNDVLDYKITFVIKETFCIGTGSICCTPDWETISFNDEYVQCVCG